jgi:hypothetical protein
MRTAICATLALVLLCSLHSPVAADETGIAADKKLAKELENLADLCYAMGIKAKDSGIYNYAKSFFNHALLYDPDHKETRKMLGFKKKGKDWVADKEDYGMPTRNTIRPEKEREVYEKIWLETKDIREKAADKLYEFVADPKLDTKQRVLALHHLMLIDPWHVKGHRAAAMDNTEAGTSTDPWTHKLDAEFSHNRRDWLKDAPKATAVKDKTPYEETLGMSFGKARGERFFIHVNCAGDGEQVALNLAPYADATWLKCCEYMGITPDDTPKEDAKRLHFTVLDDRPNYAKFIESCAGIDDAQRRKEIAEQGWGYATRKPTGNVWLYPRPQEDAGLRDGMAHEIGSYTIASKCGYRLYWLNRGLGFTMSNRACGTVRANFSLVRGSQVIPSDVEAMPGNGTCTAAWRFLVVLAIAGGKTLGLTELTRSNSSNFGELQCAFGFAYTEFLLTKYKDKLAPFLKSAYDDTYERYKKKESPESADETLARLLKHLDTSSDALQTDFALWAVDNYLKLPK